jgi:hypothetical protein
MRVAAVLVFINVLALHIVLICRIVRNREVRGPEGKTVLEPCSPGERNAIAVTLTELAEKGMASQVSGYITTCSCIDCSSFRTLAITPQFTVYERS